MAKKKAKKNNHKRLITEQELLVAIFGIVLIVLAILSVTGVGLLGKQIANLFRLFTGDGYLLTSAVSFIFGLVMVIYSKLPKLGFKRTSGLFLSYIGLLLIFAINFYQREQINAHFVAGFWGAMQAEFGRANNTQSVGGGLIGAIFAQILIPLISKLGTLILAWFMLPIGLLMFFDVKFRTIIAGVQSLGQGFIHANREKGSQLKDKYLEYRERKEEANNRANLQDPWSEPDDDPFSVNSSPAAPTEPEQSFPDPLPEVEADLPSSDAPVAITPNFDDDQLPPSHAHLDEDQQILQNNANVDHGEFQFKEASDNYQKPSTKLLEPYQGNDQAQDKKAIGQNTQVLEKTFNSFGVQVNVKDAVVGPTVTRYEVQPAIGVKVSRIVNLADDLALALAAKDIRIEAPIPGKPLVGIEVPNKAGAVVSFRDVMEHQDQKAAQDPMDVPLGKDVSGSIISANLTAMPHLLIAGSTGSGKSVMINTMLTSILMKARPEEVKLILIDPKMVELSVFAGVPHLLIPVVTDSKLAAKALHKAVKEMERRYQLFAATKGVKNIDDFNHRVQVNNADKSNPVMEKMPYIVVVVDELSDLMMVGGHEVENAIVRLGQMARAAGIHLVLATQRPSVDVITGLIKANVPSRISFAVSSGVDSRTILDQTGAEKLLGRGDMLYMPIGASKPERIQGAYISVDEVEKVVDWVKAQQDAEYDESMIPSAQDSENSAESLDDEDQDEFYEQAVELVQRQQSASVSMLQRRFRIGYNRAARIIDEMEARGVVGPSEGAKPRKVLLEPDSTNGDENA